LGSKAMSRRKNNTEMVSIVEASRNRDGSIESFCSAHNISTATFYYWRKKLKSSKGQAGFVPIEVDDIVSSDPADESLSTSLVIVFKNVPDVNYLKALMHD